MAEPELRSNLVQTMSGAKSTLATADFPHLFGALPEGIIHAAHEAIVTVDEAQRIVMMNPAAERMFACSVHEALGSDLSRFIPARHRDAHAAHVREFSESGVAERSMGTRGRVTGLRANGQEFPAAAAISRVQTTGEFGSRHFYTALLRDLSVEQGLEHELRVLQRRFQLVFEMAPVAFCILDGERILATNRAFEVLLDRPAASSERGASLFDILGAEARPQLEPLLARATSRRAGEPVVDQGVLTLDGGQRVFEVGLATLPDNGRTALQLVLTDVTQRNAERAELEHSRHELRQLSASVVRARESARLHIARELHDELGQRLSALKLDLASLDPADGAPGFGERVTGMFNMLDETMTAVRRITADLRPLMLDDLGLNAALEWLARESARRMGIEVTVRLGEHDPRLDGEATIAVYRIVQEALTNAARHSRATDVHIELHESGGELALTVQDNGVGFATGAIRKPGSFGLLGIRERAQLLGGSMQTENPLVGGARVTVRLPLRGAAEPGGTLAQATP